MATPRAFLSYAHADDRTLKGAITVLRKRLQDFYGLVAGSELEIFLDKDGIEWGKQ